MIFDALTPVEIEVIQLSLRVSFWAVVASLPPGIIAAWLLARKDFPGKTLFDGLVHLPLVLPPVVTGYMLLIVLGRKGILGETLYHLTGLSFAFNWKGAALASAVMAFPLLVRAVRLSIEAVDRGLEDAARTLGAGPLRVFFYRDPSLDRPGYPHRNDPCLCKKPERIRSDHYLCIKHSRGDPNHPPCSLYHDPAPRWRGRGIKTLHHFHRYCPHGTDGLGNIVPQTWKKNKRRAVIMLMTGALEVEVSKRLGDFELDVKFRSGKTGITALTGPSGAGKSSVINMIAGLIKPRKGRIAVNGTCVFDSQKRINVKPEKRRFGYVFQEGRLFPHISVKSNLSYGMKLIPLHERYIKMDQIINMLGIENLLNRRPARLSGGEKQRVAIGRALLTSPRLLLMDEPLASLDAARKSEVLPFIKRLPEELSIPILYVTHNLKEISDRAENIVVLDSGKHVSN